MDNQYRYVLLFIVVTVASSLYRTPAALFASAQTAFSAAPLVVDFGLRGPGPTELHKVNLLNPNDRELQVHRIRSGCGCLRVDASLPIIVPARSQVSVGVWADIPANQHGRFTYELTFDALDHSGRSVSAVVQGTYMVVPAVGLIPPALDFIVDEYDESASRMAREVTLYNTPGVPIRVLEFLARNKNIKADIVRDETKPMMGDNGRRHTSPNVSTQTIVIRVDASQVLEADWVDEVRIRTDHPAFDTVVLRVRGQQKLPVSANPSSVNFGWLDSSTAIVTRQVRLTSKDGTSDVRIRSIRIEGADAGRFDATLLDTDLVELRLSLHGSVISSLIRCNLLVEFDNPADARLRIPVRASVDSVARDR